MKVIRKTWRLFCFLAMALIMIGTIRGTASAKERAGKLVESTMKTSADIVSPLHTLAKASDDPEVTFAEHETNVLQSDTHVLSLENTTESMEVTFKSSDPSVLSVKKKSDTNCTYTGESYGTAEIIVTVRTYTIFFFWSDATTYRTKISVTPHATSVKCVKSTLTLTEGKKATLSLTIRPSISDEVPIYRSKNTKIAVINAQGKITAKEAGITYITATIANGKTDRCRIVVKKK